ncbi:MAG: thiamine diphosphokinase [Candidatus Lambdaproteobacteria bacterium RIFOXYD1_FULL_56_27]|uniref:Thiamine diphosphokinase n=1 Tax=Candidatus Lambdaproteobacteria bacterium RIFOXYD2_FULL_56_26 TaxID=1817773 RepID=A0A1F6H3Q5_9PROT|nr:MAG: thiamine diphosphokinase [Candidatus Lambdaproteobacteria bacterium RIFOXYC1_FULL_56_13]OGH05008.1 MAG: thiamine diphosphokinase [Candidatus Lambdaproteobacteria bacterium RIFOXYD2_FULL_56_26]OGH09473.1 MAG: thiamine diphosphokinase [Candidatus Lambdaproteobacteria bacterium RIFOXYD1_FULL_56_27]
MEGYGLVCLNGQPPHPETVLELWPAATFRLAADGALSWLAGMGLTPDGVIGDLDSQDSSLLPQVPRIAVPSQDSCDADKALAWALAQGAKAVVVLGAFGLRMDMTLYNLMLPLRFPSLSLSFRQDREEVFLAPRQGWLQTRPGQRISWLPLSGPVTGLKVTGLAWPLTGETLEPQGLLSLSNQATGKEVSWSYEQGHLLIFVALPGPGD